MSTADTGVVIVPQILRVQTFYHPGEQGYIVVATIVVLLADESARIGHGSFEWVAVHGHVLSVAQTYGYFPELAEDAYATPATGCIDGKSVKRRRRKRHDET